MSGGGESSSLSSIGKALHTLSDEVETYLKELPPADRYHPPVIDWHHPDEYGQTEIAGLTKFLTQVNMEKRIVDAPPAEYSTNLIALEGTWAAFIRSPRPLVGIAQFLDKSPRPKGGTKVDVICDGGNEWVKVNTIKESRLLMELREHDSYVNSDYESDTEDAPPPFVNSLFAQAQALVEAAKTHTRLPGLPPPRVRYVLTRLERGGHADRRIEQTLNDMEALGIKLDFASLWSSPPDPPPIQRPLAPGSDIVLDLSVLIALCCDSTHYPLPANEDELESRFRMLSLTDNKLQLAPHSHGSRDLRDQLRCEMVHPLVQELQERLAGMKPRFWVTEEVRDRLPLLVDVIGGEAERARAKALFSPDLDFWAESRWRGQPGCLEGIYVRVLEESNDAPPLQHPSTAFDQIVSHVCDTLLAAPEKHKFCRRPKGPKGAMAPSRLPSGHTLRTLQASITRQATLLTNNRGAVLKVLREAGIPDGLAIDHNCTHARIWVVNPSSLAECRRLEVQSNNAKIVA